MVGRPRPPVELGELVEKQAPVVCQGDFAGRQARPAADTSPVFWLGRLVALMRWLFLTSRGRFITAIGAVVLAIIGGIVSGAAQAACLADTAREAALDLLGDTEGAVAIAERRLRSEQR